MHPILPDHAHLVVHQPRPLQRSDLLHPRCGLQETNLPSFYVLQNKHQGGNMLCISGNDPEGYQLQKHLEVGAIHHQGGGDLTA